MTWTNQKPKQVGWYWFRKDRDSRAHPVKIYNAGWYFISGQWVIMRELTSRCGSKIVLANSRGRWSRRYEATVRQSQEQL